MTDDRSEMEAARLAGLQKRHERRLENATYTAAEVKVLTEAALRLGRKETLDDAISAIEDLRSPVTHGDHARGWNSALRDAPDRLRFFAKAADATSGRTDPEEPTP